MGGGCAYIARHVFLPALQKNEGGILTAVASRDRDRAVDALVESARMGKRVRV